MNNTQVLTEQEVSEVRESAEESTAAAERRASKRLAFSVVPSMATYNGSELPRKAAFGKVLCQDISTSGISFIVPHQPDFDHAVIALGMPPRLIYVSARITNVRPATKGFLVGCSFLSKVKIGA